MDEATVSRTLSKLGWNPQPHGGGTFRSTHDTDEGELVAYVRLTDNWLIASIVPFLTTRGDNSFELARWLLRLNRDLYQCKFAYDGRAPLDAAPRRRRLRRAHSSPRRRRKRARSLLSKPVSRGA